MMTHITWECARQGRAPPADAAADESHQQPALAADPVDAEAQASSRMTCATLVSAAACSDCPASRDGRRCDRASGIQLFMPWPRSRRRTTASRRPACGCGTAGRDSLSASARRPDARPRRGGYAWRCRRNSPVGTRLNVLDDALGSARRPCEMSQRAIPASAATTA